MLGLDNPIHIAFVLVLLLLIFGAKRLPEMGHSLGAGLRGFKESLSGESHGIELDPAHVATPVGDRVVTHIDSDTAQPVVEHSPAAPAA